MRAEASQYPDEISEGMKDNVFSGQAAKNSVGFERQEYISEDFRLKSIRSRRL